MHELSIALNIAEIVDEEMSKTHYHQLLEIELEIGKMSGIIPELLLFSLKEGIPGHPVHHAGINVHEIEGKGRCYHCQFEFPVENFFDQCPRCKNFGFEIIEGKELRIKSLLFA